MSDGVRYDQVLALFGAPQGEVKADPLRTHGFPLYFDPFCTSCHVPVEEYRILVEPDHDRVVIHAKCHGKTDSVILTREDVMAGAQCVLFRHSPGFNSHNVEALGRPIIFGNTK